MYVFHIRAKELNYKTVREILRKRKEVLRRCYEEYHIEYLHAIIDEDDDVLFNFEEHMGFDYVHKRGNQLILTMELIEYGC